MGLVCIELVFYLEEFHKSMHSEKKVRTSVNFKDKIPVQLDTWKHKLPIFGFHSSPSSLIHYSELRLALVKSLLKPYWLKYHYYVQAFCIKSKKDQASLCIKDICRVGVVYVSMCLAYLTLFRSL